MSRRLSLVRSLLWLGSLNAVLAFGISLATIISLEVSLNGISGLYLLLQQFGHFQFLAFLLVLPLVLLSLLFPQRAIIHIVGALVFSVFLVLIYINYKIYGLYRFHLNPMVWNLLTGGAAEEIFVFDFANIAYFGGVIGLVILAQLGMFFLIRKDILLSSRTGKVMATAVLAVMLSGQLIYAWSDAWHKTEITSQLRFIPMPQPLTVKSFLRKHDLAPNVTAPPNLDIQTQSGSFRYPLSALECRSPDPAPNIIFIVADGLRFDMLNPSVMPVWHKLSEHSQVFQRHISTGNATRFSIYGLFTGLYGNYWFDALNTQTGSVLVDVLLREEYSFGFFASAKLTSPEFDRAVFPQIRQHIPQSTPGRTVIERDQEIVRQAKAFFKDNKAQPFFSFIFFDAPHAYVSPPADQIFKPVLESLNYLNLKNTSDPLPFLNRYKNSLHFVDRLTGELLTQLENLDLMSETIIVLTGDHGQEANETRTNSWGHNSNFSRYQVQTPLVVYWPGRQPQIFSHLTSHTDLVPTLLNEVFSCSNPIEDYSNGQSLFSTGPREHVLVKSWNTQALTDGNTVHIYSKFELPEIRDFDTYQEITLQDKDTVNTSHIIKALSQFYE